MSNKVHDINGTEEEEIQNVTFGRPHLFILGAGVSRAAFPQGERQGKNLPLMADFVEVLELGSLLKQWDIQYKSENFEQLYSLLHADPKYLDLLPQIEKKVHGYFVSLKLPSTPTLYDHLVLCLRAKDIVATFNWDPFLYWSLCRNYKYADMPHPLFLHGNVGVGYCMSDKIMGVVNQRCSKCNEIFTNIPLLYPVMKKNYTADPFISNCWDEVKKFMGHAYIFTIFGYSAPTTDVEAIRLLKEGWGDVHQRKLEEVEIIDIKDKTALELTWKDFIHTHHSMVYHNFYDSFLARHPRRSCEAMWEMLMQCKLYPDRKFPKDAPFDELWGWIKPLVEVERTNSSGAKFRGHTT